MLAAETFNIPSSVRACISGSAAAATKLCRATSDPVAEYAAAAVKEKNIAMDSFTRTNLEALGIASGSALNS